MASTASTATPARHSFNARVSAVRTPKSDINAVILDYLTMEGYPRAAANFAREANIPYHQETSAIQERQVIREHIHRGNIKAAIERLNDLEPEILGRNEPLHFALLRLQLVELIRASSGGDITEAIKFAQEQLGPRTDGNKQFLKDLELTMTLLFFTEDDMPAPVRQLLDPALRMKVADHVNKAILDIHSQRRMATIHHVVRLRQWAENTARSRKVDLPSSISLGLDAEEQNAGDEHHNGHEAMVTS